MFQCLLSHSSSTPASEHKTSVYATLMGCLMNTWDTTLLRVLRVCFHVHVITINGHIPFYCVHVTFVATNIEKGASIAQTRDHVQLCKLRQGSWSSCNSARNIAARFKHAQKENKMHWILLHGLQLLRRGLHATMRTCVLFVHQNAFLTWWNEAL